MDDLGRLVGNGIASLVGSAVDAIRAAIGGIGAALGSAVPAGALPIVAVVVALLVGLFLLRR